MHRVKVLRTHVDDRPDALDMAMPQSCGALQYCIGVRCVEKIVIDKFLPVDNRTDLKPVNVSVISLGGFLSHDTGKLNLDRTAHGLLADRQHKIDCFGQGEYSMFQDIVESNHTSSGRLTVVKIPQHIVSEIIERYEITQSAGFGRILNRHFCQIK